MPTKRSASLRWWAWRLSEGLYIEPVLSYNFKSKNVHSIKIRIELNIETAKCERGVI